MLAILVMWPGSSKDISVPSAPEGFKFACNWPSGFWGGFWNRHTMRILGQKSKIHLDLLYSHSFIYSWRLLNKQVFFFVCLPKFQKHSIKSSVLEFSHIWPWRQRSVSAQGPTFWIIVVVLDYPMLNDKFLGHLSICPGEEDF